MDAYTSTAELIGSRNAGDGDLTLWVAHADDPTPAPTGVRVLRLPTRDGWMLVRILVDGADDARLVHKLQDAITLRVLKPDASAAEVADSIGRLAVNMTAGATGYPRRRFVELTAVAAVTWSLYSVAIGLTAGVWFRERPLVAIAIGVELRILQRRRILMTSLGVGHFTNARGRARVNGTHRRTIARCRGP